MAGQCHERVGSWLVMNTW